MNSSGLTVHKQIYGTTKRQITNLVHDAKSYYYNTKITERKNYKQLFTMTDKLLGRRKTTLLLTKGKFQIHEQISVFTLTVQTIFFFKTMRNPSTHTKGHILD